MALNKHGGCYCCSHSVDDMDISLALDELGMLSCMAERRNPYREERMRTRSESALMTKKRFQPTRSLQPSTSTSCYQIAHIDKTYVAGFTDISAQTSDVNPAPINSQTFPPGLDNYKHYRMPSENFDSMVDKMRSLHLKYKHENYMNAKNRRLLARKHVQQPYEIPWRPCWSFEENLFSCRDDISEPKSNYPSPVKPSFPFSLPRSKSLDNINISTVSISTTGEKADIDKVAYGLKNLNMSNL